MAAFLFLFRAALESFVISFERFLEVFAASFFSILFKLILLVLLKLRVLTGVVVLEPVGLERPVEVRSRTKTTITGLWSVVVG